MYGPEQKLDDSGGETMELRTRSHGVCTVCDVFSVVT